MRDSFLAIICALLLVQGAGSASAQIQPELEFIGRVETLPTPMSPYWLWASDAILKKMTLVDLHSGEVLGSLDGGLFITTALFPSKGDRFYVPETHYTLGNRGERIDQVTFYDAKTLTITDEVRIPAKRAHSALPVGNAAISDDGRFLAIFNMTPAQSLSIVDTQSRQFVTEIATPGCALAYAAGDRRFFMLCGNGALMLITLDDDGRVRSQERSETFFDPVKDPITEKGVRAGNDWYFVSFDGYLYRIGLTDSGVTFFKPWSLLSDADRKQRWRVGGRQFVAVDEPSGRAFVLLHQGDVDTHKIGGTHLGVYDLRKQQAIERIALETPGFTFSGISMEFGTHWIWPFNGLYNFIGRKAMAVEAHTRPDAVLVTGGSQPLLVLAGEFSGSLAIYDANSLKFLYRVATSNWTTLAIQSPRWGQ